MRSTLLLSNLMLVLAFFVGCDDEARHPATCDELIDDFGSCIDDFCADEGLGSSYCDCWRQRYGVRVEGCQCETEIWLVRARGLCTTIGAESYSSHVNCASGITFARDWIAGCD